MRLRAALACLLLSATTAAAGDFAGFQAVGFSPDGAVFAFEEFGVQDGSGFPYSSLYFIDTGKDAFLPGTPVRVRIDDEGASLADARARSREKAAALIAAHDLLANPGVLAAFNPMGEIGVNRRRIDYSPHAVEPMPGGGYALELEETAFAPPEKCRDVTPSGSKGFRLRLIERDGAPADRLLHEDTRIPDSRNCPLSYQISGAVTFHPYPGAPVHVALVLVRSHGFEGSDGRWLAVPFRP